MKVAVFLALFAASVAFAQESSTNYYIERYPGDGMKQRPRVSPPTKAGDIVSPEGFPELGASSTNAVGTNTQTKAARFISPRTSSKEFAPSRLSEPKVKTVVITPREKKIAPPPKVSDKAGVASNPPLPPAEPTASTNSLPAASPPAK